MNLFNKFLYKSNKNVIKNNFFYCSSLSKLCRSFMYVPGDKEKMITKITNLPATQAPDVMILDCEDGVAFSNKSLARKNIFESIKNGALKKCSHSTVCIRINALTSSKVVNDDIDLIEKVLKVSNYVYPRMILLPKTENKTDLFWLDEQLKSKINVNKLPAQLQLSVIIESVQSVMRLKELLHHFTTEKWSCFKLSHIVFGSDDYCASMGTSRSRSNNEVLYARQYVSNVAAAYKIPAIDMVDTDLNDMEYFEKNCLFGAGIGFLGKQVIHPKQLEVVHSAFSPSLEKINWATELLKEFEKNEEAGHGAFTFRGHMVDMPTVIQAKKVVGLSKWIKSKE